MKKLQHTHPIQNSFGKSNRIQTKKSPLVFKIFLTALCILTIQKSFGQVLSDSIVIDGNNLDLINRTHFSVKKHSDFMIKFKDTQKVEVKFVKKETNHKYQTVDFYSAFGVSYELEKTGNTDSLDEQADTPTFVNHKVYISADEITINIIIARKNNAVDSLTITLTAMHYLQGMPMGGLNLSWFKNKSINYYVPELPSTETSFGSDSSYLYKLKSRKEAFNPNVFVGYSLNYVIKPTLFLGAFAGLNYALGTKEKPLGPTGGICLSLGSNYKFNIGYSISAQKVNQIPDDVKNMAITSKFSEAPAVPTGFDKWILGQGVAIGFTVQL